MNRVALVCNICFLLTFVLQRIQGIDKYQILVGTVGVLGLLVAIVFNIIVIIVTAIAFLMGKKSAVPTSLFLINLVIFFLEFYFFFIVNHNEIINHNG